MWGNSAFGNDGFNNQQNQGGGGFMTGTGGGTAGPVVSQAKQGVAGKSIQTVVPCNIAQIIKAQKDDNDCFIVNGIELSQVTVVGVVRKVQEMNTSIVYEIDDYTAEHLTVRVWVDADGNVANVDEVRQIAEGTYVRVYGQLRIFMTKKSLVAFRIHPLRDMNELTSHMLEVVYSHMYLDKKRQGLLDKTTSASSMNTTAMQGGGRGTTPGNSAGFDNGLTQFQKQVHEFITTATDPNGMSVQVVQNKFWNTNKDQIRKIVLFLNDEGHIYSTIDDEHFKATDSL